MENCQGSHSIHNLEVHIVWITKYRYQVLQDEIQLRCCDIVRRICNYLNVSILKRNISKDHVHLHLSYSLSLSVSNIVKRIKGYSSRLLLKDFPELKRRYWDGHFLGNRLRLLEHRSCN